MRPPCGWLVVCTLVGAMCAVLALDSGRGADVRCCLTSGSGNICFVASRPASIAMRCSLAGIKCHAVLSCALRLEEWSPLMFAASFLAQGIMCKAGPLVLSQQHLCIPSCMVCLVLRITSVKAGHVGPSCT